MDCSVHCSSQSQRSKLLIRNGAEVIALNLTKPYFLFRIDILHTVLAQIWRMNCFRFRRLTLQSWQYWVWVHQNWSSLQEGHVFGRCVTILYREVRIKMKEILCSYVSIYIRMLTFFTSCRKILVYRFFRAKNVSGFRVYPFWGPPVTS